MVFSKMAMSNQVNLANLPALGYLDETNLKGMIKELVELHKKGILTDEEFSTLISVLGAKFVENEVTEQVNETIENQIFPNLFLRFLNV